MSALLTRGTVAFTSSEGRSSFSLYAPPFSICTWKPINMISGAPLWPRKRMYEARLAQVLPRERRAREERVVAGFERERGGEVPSCRVAADEEPL